MNDKFKIGDLVKIKTTSKSKYKEAIGIFENYCKGRNLEICRVRLWRNKVIQICDYNLEKLYNADYRKASEVAREIFDEIEKHVQEQESAISMFEDGEDDFYDGKRYAFKYLTNLLAELKKKYTEVGNGKQRN